MTHAMLRRSLSRIMITLYRDPLAPLLQFRAASTSNDPTTPDHWLPPSAQRWLDATTRRLWITALVRGQPTLQHHAALIKTTVEREYGRLMAEHENRVVDARSYTHLSTASLAAATHRVLVPLLRDEQEVMAVINRHMGAKTTPMLKLLLRFTTWLGLPPDAYAALGRRLAGLQMDYGRGFDSKLDIGTTQSTLTITTCFYHSFFTDIGLPQLSATTCCSQDRFWIEGVRHEGILAGLVASQATGDAACCFRVLRVPKTV